MKVLIIGEHSFLGNNVKQYLEKSNGYDVDIVDAHEGWKRVSFSEYKVIINVSAIVHRFDEIDESLYFEVNRDLALDLANKAKNSGVAQFIQISTMGVFGIELGEEHEKFGYHPVTPYERSKYEADIRLEKLRTPKFHICIVRPPMIYGKTNKGNFPKLEKFAVKSPIFPKYRNFRDFIYVENISDFLKFAIDNDLNEITYPRDSHRISTYELVQKIASCKHKKIVLTAVFNPFIRMIYKSNHSLRSVFGDNYCTMPVCSKNWKCPYEFSTALEKMYKAD